MDINAKIKLIAETMSGYTVLVDSSNGANVELSKITMPCILIFIQDTGEVLSTNSHYRDSVNIRVAFLNKMSKGFKESDVETMRYELKQDMFILFHKLKFDFQFKTNTESLRYEIVYDEFDDNLIGVVFNDNIKERVGLNLSCDVPDSHGELPSSPSFCQKVSECSSIVSIYELIDGLQEQIDNLPTTTGVESISGNQVNNTDPLNPIVEPLGLIQIIDKAGDFFTDLATAIVYVEQYFNPAFITDKSFNNGIFYFTVPNSTSTENISVGFLSAADGISTNSASFVDEFGLVSSFLSASNFERNSGYHIMGNVYFQVGDFNEFSGTVRIQNLIGISAALNYFGLNSTGKFIIEQNLGSTETANFGVTFFSGSTATILVKANKYISNSGGIHGDLQTAIANGCNVFFDGIDKENIRNKALNFNVLDNNKYPTTQATKDLVDYYVQSNIKIIGDWDATSGSYPLADESNTTPFISQWGATIKQGFAFRVGYGQAGTVDGFDYENGDVVYALIDSPTDNSSHWGDLDQNLQQANESLRGTAKIASDVIVSDETSTDDERIVTTKKLWLNFWTRVLAIAHTFAAKITFTTAPRFNSASASQYLKTDSNKDLTSVSAIPAADITEDTLRRFVTDLERLKINRFSYTDTVLGTATSGIGNQFSKSVLIPGNTLKNGALNIKGRAVKSGTSSFGWLNIYINTANNLIGAKHLGQINSSGGNTLANFSIDRTIPIQAGSFTTFIINTTNGFEETVTNQSGTQTIDWTVDQYVILSCQCNVGTDNMKANFLSVVQH